MGVPIALYSSPPSTVCSTYPCSDFDLNSRSSPVTVGGLSCLFGSSISMKHSSDDHGSLRQTTCFSTLDRAEELGSSFGYSSLGSSFKSRDQSPISVFHAPVSCSSVGSRSPSVRIPRDRVGETSFKSHRDGLFKSFVSNAFFPVDYDSRSISMLAASEVQEKISPLEVEEELTFSLEENFDDKLGELMDGRCNEGYAREILARAQDRHMIFHQDFVIRAFHEAERAHRGQMRANGDPYLQHCVETALLLAEIGANTTIVAAGLLHDTLDDAFVEYDYICKNFGSGVGDLVEGVSRLSHLSKLARENNTASRTVEADRLHTMFLAMVDARAVLIKLADRLHNMMTLDALPVAKQRSFAEETLQVFSPLANRLGISTWKEQLENLCLKHLHPVQYDELAAKLVKPLREATISAAIDKLGSALNTEDIQYHVLSGRRKSLYSIYSKMLKKKLTMDGVHDIHGLRLIVENENDCFAALDIVHSLWPQMPGKLKDYISHPKDNGYQSLHTVVMGEDMVPLEVQIRTKEMHLHAEFGIAAHWRYKEGNCMHPSCVLRIVEYARWVVTWQAAYSIPSLPGSDSIRPPSPFPSHSDDCPYASSMLYLRQDGPVFVIVLENEKMSVQEYPTNCSVADLLDKFGKDDSVYGVLVKKELRPRINGLPVSDLHRKLKMGDVVELTPAIPDESLTECREEIRRMFDRDLILSKKAVGSSSS